MWLNGIAPAFNWFFVLEHTTTVLAFAGLIYGVLAYVRMLPGMVMLGLVAWRILPNCIATSNYTYVAFLATCAGGFLLVARIGKGKAGVGSVIGGSLLVLLGLLWRYQMFLVGIPFIGFVYLRNIWVYRESFKRDVTCLGEAPNIVLKTDSPLSFFTRFYWLRELLPAAACLSVCVLAFLADATLWQQNGWREWQAYNAPRTITSDYPMPDYDDVSAELAQMGVTENDYWMIRNWANADTDVLNTELLAKVSTLRKPLPSAIEGARLVTNYAKTIIKRWYIVLPCLFCLATLGLNRKQGYAVALLEVLLAFVVCSYYVFIERLIDRVEDPTWFYAICLCVAMSANKPFAGIEVKKSAVGAVIFAFLSIFTLYKNLPNLCVENFLVSLSQDTYEAQGAISQYVAVHPGNIFILDSGLHTAYEREYSFRYLPESLLAERVIPLGGWGSGSPFRVAQCSSVGATNPVQALVKSDTAYLITNADIASHVERFIQEHYNQDAHLEAIESLEQLGAGEYLWGVSS